MNGVFLDLATYRQEPQHEAMLKPLRDDGWVFHDGTAPEEVVARLQGAEALITNKVRITREVLEGCPDLKLIIVGATGVDNVDVAAARAHGVAVSNVRGYSTASVSQYVFATVLSLMNSVPQYDALVKSGAWERNKDFCLLDYPMSELSGKVMGLYGYGAIAKAVERIALAFGMEVILAERKGAGEIREGRLPFADVLARADVISFHCPLTDETRGLVGAVELAAMKDTAILVNAARGGVVVEQDLADVLRDGTIGGAAVDVVSQEPPRDGNPLLAPDLGNLVITPHCAWASSEARTCMFEQIVQIVDSYKGGAPMNVVN
jgi:glycerate dehydrogenase